MKKFLIFTLLLFLSCKIFSQEKLDITGEWVSSDFIKTDSIWGTIQLLKLEHFSGQDYIVLLEAFEKPPRLYKARKIELGNDVFFDALWIPSDLEKNEKPFHIYFYLQNFSEDSIRICFLDNWTVDLGNKDLFDSVGVLSAIDTTNLGFKLISQESFAFQSDEEYMNWLRDQFMNPKAGKRAATITYNPNLFDYLLQKNWSQLSKRNLGFSQTFYRWKFFKWDQVNHFKRKDIISAIRLDRELVYKTFEILPIDSLLRFREGGREPSKISSMLSDYHLVRNYSVSIDGWGDDPSFWIFVFKDGSRIKVKLNFRRTVLFDVTNNRLYYNKNGKSW